MLGDALRLVLKLSRGDYFHDILKPSTGRDEKDLTRTDGQGDDLSRTEILKKQGSIVAETVFQDSLDIGDRIKAVRQRIRDSIVPAKISVERDIALSNQDKVLLSVTNFLGGESINLFKASDALAEHVRLQSL